MNQTSCPDLDIPNTLPTPYTCDSPVFSSPSLSRLPTSFPEAPHLPTQLSQTLQWEVRGGRNILQVKQYFSFTICPLIITSRVRGGGRYVELPVLSEGGRRERWGVSKPGVRSPS